MIKKYCCGPFFTNTYVVTYGLNAVVIDPGLGFEAYAQEVNQTYDVLAILLTHGHIDHIDAIGCFSCPIYIHKDEKNFLEDETLSLYRMMGKHRSFSLDSLNLHLIDDGEILSFKDMKFQVIATPGHTKGSVCYAYQQSLFSGDTLFHFSQGRTDFPTGNEHQIRASLKKLMDVSVDSWAVYPGHDEKTTIKIERQKNPFVIQALK